MEGILSRGRGRGRSPSTRVGAWKGSFHGVGGVEGVLPRTSGRGRDPFTGVGGVEGVLPRTSGRGRVPFTGVGGVEGVLPRRLVRGRDPSTGGWGVERILPRMVRARNQSFHEIRKRKGYFHGRLGVQGDPSTVYMTVYMVCEHNALISSGRERNTHTLWCTC